MPKDRKKTYSDYQADKQRNQPKKKPLPGKDVNPAASTAARETTESK